MNVPVSDVNSPPAADNQPDPKALLRAALDALPDHAAVLDAQGTIVMTNTSWQQHATSYGKQPGLPATHSDVGVNYLERISHSHNTDDSAGRAVQGIHDVLSGHMEAFCLTYLCRTCCEQIWFTMTVTALVWDNAPGVLITHTDTTPRHRLNRR